ncbi:SPX domain-containing protein [Perilla frutescens var. frutescens]|nr:SPX domain-containing protein [Perilla frutescens var. frutescens]
MSMKMVRTEDTAEWDSIGYTWSGIPARLHWEYALDALRNMKFCNKYEELILGLGQKNLPRIGCRRLKNILENCTKQLHLHAAAVHDDQNNGDGISTDPRHCSVCDGTFFPMLLKEMCAVVGFFNKRAQRLLDHHLASGFCKCFIWLGERLIVRNDVALIQECETLIAYATINAIAMRRILEKYDKIHYSKQGQAFKSRSVSMQIEILQSPWLYKLMAFHVNLRESRANSGNARVVLDGCSLIFDDGKPSLCFELIESNKISIDLTCSICLETLFDPVSLGCGHLFCYMCACKASSVSVVEGLKAACPHKKCPICREVGVYDSAVNLEELHILLKRSYPEYWEERCINEKAERLQQVKQHWQSQAARFMGI